MKQILFVQDTATYKTGDIIEAEDQFACDAIAYGFAVPSNEDKSMVKSPEQKVITDLEVK
jgi:hypothetical protein